MTNPWAGGLNTPQWASFDINNDGKKDLYAFDRTGDVHLSFLNMDDTPGNMEYQYDREWLKHFPRNRNFVLVRDYNLDGTPDIFCSSFDDFITGIKVYQGRWENGFLQFDRILFPQYEDDVIPFMTDDGTQDLVCVFKASDYIAIDDIDGDSDLDILAPDKDGQKLNLYKNRAIENGFTTDTLLFEWADDCWGRFGIEADTHALTLSLDPNLCAFFKQPEEDKKHLPVHGGTTLCTFDSDNDGDKEILYGDLTNNSIIFGKNNGNPNSAWMSEQDPTFPSYDLSIDIPNFGATYLVDANNDGLKDLIASPNQYWFTPDQQTAWLYENVGSNEHPDFSFSQTDFLGETMLDFGTGARPVFADVNADGLMDLVVGNRFYWTADQLISSLVLMLNTGTAAAPVFEISNEDWLELSQYSPDLNTFSPTFGDLDGDGDQDLLLGDRSGDLHLLENIADPNMPMEFGPLQPYWQGINVGSIATPFIYDINQDSLPDLLVGELRGVVNYFPNIGTVTSPLFHPIAEEQPNNFFFGEINTQSPGSVAGYTQPVVLESDDSLFLVTGTWEGSVKKYLINQDSLDGGSFEKLDEKWGNTREGSATFLTFTNLNDDEFLESVIGNDRGGLTIFKTPIKVDGMVNNDEMVESEKPYLLFPNPTNEALHIHANEEITANCYDLLGRVVFNKNLKFTTESIDVSHLPSGTYWLKIQQKDKLFLEKVIVIH